MTIDQAMRCLPGRRVEDWAVDSQGTVSQLRVRHDDWVNETHVWLTIRYDFGDIVTYQDDEVEFLDLV